MRGIPGGADRRAQIVTAILAAMHGSCASPPILRNWFAVQFPIAGIPVACGMLGMGA